MNNEDNSENPWNVENAAMFLKFCCPECEFTDKRLLSFTEHARKTHAKSSILFLPENIEDSKEQIIKIEPEVIQGSQGLSVHFEMALTGRK